MLIQIYHLLPKNIDSVNIDGLRVNNYNVDFNQPYSKNFTLCLVMTLWFNRNFSIQLFKDSRLKTKLHFDKIQRKLFLSNNLVTSITLPNSFIGKTVVIWLTENNTVPKRQYQIILPHLH